MFISRRGLINDMGADGSMILVPVLQLVVASLVAFAKDGSTERPTDFTCRA